jgi:hypothetical protein
LSKIEPDELWHKLEMVSEILDKLRNDVSKLIDNKDIDSKEWKEFEIINRQPYFDNQDDIINLGIDQIQESFRIISDNYLFLMTAVGRYRWRQGDEPWEISLKGNSIDDIDDERIVHSLEPFTNPRRIKIMKTLFTDSLTSSQLMKKTGLVGGQLYHHLSILESGRLVMKIHDKYVLSQSGARLFMVLMLFSGETEANTRCPVNNHSK